MPYNGSGTFVRVRNWVNDALSGIKIRADRHDTEDDNFAQGLSQCITKDGQTTITNNLPMANYRHTGVGEATAANQYARYDQVLLGKTVWAIAGGSADSLTATYAIPTAAPVDGQLYYVRATAANATTTPTFAADGNTARTIVKNGNSALSAGDIAGAGHELILRYRSADTKYELLNPAITGKFMGTVSAVGSIAVAGTSSASALISLAEDTDNGTNKVSIQAPSALASDYTLTLPVDDGVVGQYPVTDGFGALSWVTNPFLEGFKNRVLNGLTFSNNITDATNDIDIASGACVSDDGTTIMTLGAITKRLDAVWSVGTGNGGLDTGSVANTTYHIWVINRPDTNVTDVLFSTSPTAPTLPTNYTKKKVIGSFIRSGGSIVAFVQVGNEFRVVTPVLDVSLAGTGTSANTATLASVPTGAKFKAIMNVHVADNGACVYISDLACADLAASFSAAPLAQSGSNTTLNAGNAECYTNTGAQIRYRTNSNTTVRISVLGWVDPRIA